MTSQMDLLYVAKGKVGHVGECVPPLVRACDMDIVHVQQQTTSGPLGDLLYEVRLTPGALLVPDVCRGVLQQHLSAQSGLYLINVLADRSEEHTSELQSLMRISYAVFCLQKKKHLE